MAARKQSGDWEPLGFCGILVGLLDASLGGTEPTVAERNRPPERRNPAPGRDFGEAAEGIRTLELLHGKQTVEHSHGALLTNRRPGSAAWMRHHTSGARVITLSSQLAPHRPANLRTAGELWLYCAAVRGGA